MAKNKVEETMQEVEEKVEKKDAKSIRRQINSQLRRDRKNVMVEILNIGYKQCCYFDYNERPYFELMPGDMEVLSLEDITEVSNRAKGHFKNYDIIITDVLDDNYTVNDVIEYLGLSRLYKNIPNVDENFLETLIYDYDLDEFKDAIRKGSKEFVQAVGGKMLLLFKDKDERRDLDMDKMKFIAKKLRLTDILEEIMAEDLI